MDNATVEHDLLAGGGEGAQAERDAGLVGKARGRSRGQSHAQFLNGGRELIPGLSRAGQREVTLDGLHRQVAHDDIGGICSRTNSETEMPAAESPVVLRIRTLDMNQVARRIGVSGDCIDPDFVGRAQFHAPGDPVPVSGSLLGDCGRFADIDLAAVIHANRQSMHARFSRFAELVKLRSAEAVLKAQGVAVSQARVSQWQRSRNNVIRLPCQASGIVISRSYQAGPRYDQARVRRSNSRPSFLVPKCCSSVEPGN